MRCSAREHRGPDSRAAQELVARHARRTPLLTARLLSEETGFDVRLKAELFQRTGSYKLRAGRW